MATTVTVSPSEKQTNVQKHSLFSIITCSMVNRKFSPVPLAYHERIDVMTRALHNRSYQMGLSAGQPRSRLFPGPGDLTMPTSLTASSHINSDSPHTSPFKDPSKRLHLPNSLLTPSMKDFLTIHPAAPTASSSQYLSITPINPHINPLIFDTPQMTLSASPSTIASSLPTGAKPIAKTSSLKKRPADALSDKDEEENGEQDIGEHENGEQDNEDASKPDTSLSFQVSFNYWQLVVPPEPKPSNGKKHKKTATLRSSRYKSPIPKYKN